MQGSKKDEILGVASNRLLRMDLHSGVHLQTWRYSSVKVCSTPNDDFRHDRAGIFNSFVVLGMERQLGGETHDGAVRRR